MTILEKVGKHPYNCWSPSLGWLCPPFVWWVTIIWMVEYSHFNGGWPSYGSWVTIFLKLGDCPQEGGWPNFGSCATILGKAVLEIIRGLWVANHYSCHIAELNKVPRGFVSVPETFNQLQPIFFQFWGVICPYTLDCPSSGYVIITAIFFQCYLDLLRFFLFFLPFCLGLHVPGCVQRAHSRCLPVFPLFHKVFILWVKNKSLITSFWYILVEVVTYLLWLRR